MYVKTCVFRDSGFCAVQAFAECPKVALDGRWGANGKEWGQSNVVWRTFKAAVPPSGSVDACGRARLERMGKDGKFEEVGAADIPFAKLVLRSVRSFDITGSGQCKFQFDDLVWKQTSVH